MAKYPIIKSTQYLAVIDSSAKFTAAMALGYTHRFTCNVDCWVLMGATGGSAAADTANNTLVIAGQELFLACDDETNGFVHAIREGSTSGKATLSRIEGD